MKRLAFGDLVREGRQRKQLSLRQLAEQTGMDYSRLSRIENGSRPAPDLSTLRGLARALDLDLVRLLVSAGTSKEVVEELLWDERLRLGDALPDVAAYRPEGSALLHKNTFEAPVLRRSGARCFAAFGEETLTVFSFSSSPLLRIEIPPEAVIVFRSDPAAALGWSENVFSARVRRVRRLGQVVNLVLDGRGFTLNALESASQQEGLRRAEERDVFVLIPAAAVRTRRAEKEE